MTTEDAIPFSDWLSIHDTTIRNATLDELGKKIDACISCCPSDARQKPITILKRVKQTIKSLRTPKEQP